MAGARGGNARSSGAARPTALVAAVVVLAVTIVVVLAVVTGVTVREGARRGPSADLASSDGGEASAAGPAPRVDPATIYDERCRPCHRLGGEGGTYGPDLDRAGRTLEAAFVRDYVLAPSALEPDARMPSARVSPAEAEALADYVVATARGVADTP